MTGFGGDDRYVFGDATGNDTVIDSAGNDTIDFSTATNGVTFSINTSNLIVTGTNTNVTHNGTAIENLIGSQGADNFVFADTATLNGYIDGQGGSDRINFAAYSAKRDFFLNALGTVDGFAGTVSGIVGGFDNINALTGTSAVDDGLFGLDADAAWELDGTDRYTSTNTLDFVGFEILNGMGGVDTFTVTGSRAYHIIRGGAGDDVIKFNSGASLTFSTVGSTVGYADGQNGNDIIDYSAFTSSETVLVNLPAEQATGFVNGNPASVGAAINFEEAIGGASADIFLQHVR